jgi:hypothetical protein
VVLEQLEESVFVIGFWPVSDNHHVTHFRAPPNLG